MFSNINFKSSKVDVGFFGKNRLFQTELMLKFKPPKSYKLKNLILDDQSYFTLGHSGIDGKSNFYSDDKQLTPCDVKYSTRKQCEQKFLVIVVVSK